MTQCEVSHINIDPSNAQLFHHRSTAISGGVNQHEWSAGRIRLYALEHARYVAINCTYSDGSC